VSAAVAMASYTTAITALSLSLLTAGLLEPAAEAERRATLSLILSGVAGLARLQ